MQLQARLLVMTVSVDKPFYVTHEVEEISQILGFKKNSTGSWDVEIGKKLNIRGVECTIENFWFRLYPEMNEPHNYGINLTREGAFLPYNIDIVVEVNDEAIRLRYQ